MNLVEIQLHGPSVRLVCAAVLTLLTMAPATAQALYQMPANVETRWASPENPKGERGVAAQANAGRKGRPSVPVKAGETLVLAESSGSSGTVHRIWVTINDRSPRMLRGLKVQMYWDGAAKPAVSAPFGDFFGTALGLTTAFQSALFTNPEGRSFTCYIPMPFRKGMRITVTNESGIDLGSLYYDVDYTLGDAHGADVLYFHTHYRRENPTTLQKDFEILPRVEGCGRWLGVNFGVIADTKAYGTTWWGEGEVKVFLDGDRDHPTLSGTGTEDYIGTGWGQGQYAHLYQGCHIADGKAMKYCFYRYHVLDPVWFRREVRATIQQIGWRGDDALGSMHATGNTYYKAGPGRVAKDAWETGLFERQDDWSATAYFYLDKPEGQLPAIDPVDLRTKGL